MVHSIRKEVLGMKKRVKKKKGNAEEEKIGGLEMHCAAQQVRFLPFLCPATPLHSMPLLLQAINNNLPSTNLSLFPPFAQTHPCSCKKRKIMSKKTAFPLPVSLSPPPY